MNNEPVAYWDGKHFASKNKSSLADIPLYTTPQIKPLTDDETWNWSKENTALTKESALRIARAIEERHGIK